MAESADVGKKRTTMPKRCKQSFMLLCMLISFFVVMGAGCVMVKKEISSSEFIALYNKDRGPGDYWKYVGIKNHFHVMRHYSHTDSQGRIDGNSTPTAYECVVTKASNMPNDFPSYPQKKIDAGPLPENF
jgi:hypothetical protein